MRAFAALDLPGEIATLLERTQAGIGIGRATDPETFHVTLAFLPDLPDHVVPAVVEELTALRPRRVPIALSGAALLGDGRVIAAEVARSEALDAIHLAARRALRQAGAVPETQRFRPHVTLVRLRRAEGQEARLAAAMAALGGLRSPPVDAPSLTLYRSILDPEGAQYDPLASWPLS